MGRGDLESGRQDGLQPYQYSAVEPDGTVVTQTGNGSSSGWRFSAPGAAGASGRCSYASLLMFASFVVGGAAIYFYIAAGLDQSASETPTHPEGTSYTDESDYKTALVLSIATVGGCALSCATRAFCHRG